MSLIHKFAEISLIFFIFHAVRCYCVDLSFLNNYVQGCRPESDGTPDFCSGMSWYVTSLYQIQNYSQYLSGGIAVDVQTQDELAKSVYQEILSDMGPNSNRYLCKQLSKLFSCTVVFGECPIAQSQSSSLYPCRSSCSQIKSLCDIQIGCSDFPNDNCLIRIPGNYFIPNPSQGPFDIIQHAYMTCLALWIIGAIISFTYAYSTTISDAVRTGDESALLSRLSLCIPVMKVVSLSLGYSFWSTCVSWQMCSFWLSIGYLNSHLVYESVFFVTFLVIAKGWGVWRSRIPAREWRLVTLTVLSFYIFNSMLTAARDELSSGRIDGFMVGCAVLYSMTLTVILRDSVKSYLTAFNQSKALSTTAISQNVDEAWISTYLSPIIHRRSMFSFFIIAVLCYTFVELFSRYLIYSQSSIAFGLIFQEIGEIIVVSSVLYSFRPKSRSVFFFITAIDRRRQDDDEEDAEVTVRRPVLLEAHLPDRENSMADCSSGSLEMVIFDESKREEQADLCGTDAVKEIISDDEVKKTVDVTSQPVGRRRPTEIPQSPDLILRLADHILACIMLLFTSRRAIIIQRPHEIETEDENENVVLITDPTGHVYVGASETSNEDA